MEYTLNDINWGDFVSAPAKDNSITGLATPSLSSDNVTKRYIDGVGLTTTAASNSCYLVTSGVELFKYSNTITFNDTVNFNGTANFNDKVQFNNTTDFSGVNCFNSSASFTCTTYFYGGIVVSGSDSNFSDVTVTDKLRLGNYGPDFAPFIKCLPNLINALGYNNAWDIQQMSNSSGYCYESPALRLMNNKILELQDKMIRLEQMCAKV